MNKKARTFFKKLPELEQAASAFLRSKGFRWNGQTKKSKSVRLALGHRTK